MNQSLLTQLETEIKTWITSSTLYFTNERDLQVKLAKHLEDSRKFDRVYTEYRVPLAELKHRGIPVEPNPQLASTRKISPSFPWNNHLSIDIVVESKGQFAAIELKYATKPINEKETLFGEDLLPETKILKSQDAGDLVMYNFWKDVRRIEMLTATFPNVVGGFAVIVTNNRAYWSEPNPGVMYVSFSLHESNTVGSGNMCWNGNPSQEILKKYPDFILSGSYHCHWDDTNITATAANKYNDKFKYLIEKISK